MHTKKEIVTRYTKKKISLVKKRRFLFLCSKKKILISLTNAKSPKEMESFYLDRHQYYYLPGLVSPPSKKKVCYHTREKEYTFFNFPLPVYYTQGFALRFSPLSPPPRGKFP